jgi:hypothetical protein
VTSASAPARAPDAIVTTPLVRLELWASQRSVAAGGPLNATGRVTNLGPKPIWYEGRPCAQILVGLVRFPAFDVYGRRHPGVAGEVKDGWAHGDGTPSGRYTTPGTNSFFGAQGPARDSRCNPEEDGAPPMSRLDPRRSVALSVRGAPEWDMGAFPQGQATLGVLFGFGTTAGFDGASGQVVYAFIPVNVSAGSPTIPPAAALDAALAAQGVPAYLQAHAHATQLTAQPRLSARKWTVDIQAIDASPEHKTVWPRVEVAVDRASGQVLSVTTNP